MNTQTKSRETFSRDFGPIKYATDQDARKARDNRAQELIREGYRVKRYLTTVEPDASPGCVVYALEAEKVDRAIGG